MQEKQHQKEQFKTEEGTGDLIGNKIADKKKVFQKNLLKNYQMMKQKKMR